MRPVQEIVPGSSDASFVCFEWDQPIFDHGYHFHDEIELIWILESDGQRLVGDHLGQFAPGELALFGSRLPHQYRNWQRGRVLARVVQWRPEAFGADFLALPECRGLRDLIARAERGLVFSDIVRGPAQAILEQLYRQASGPSRLALLLQCLDCLQADTEAQPLASPDSIKRQAPAQVERLSRVLDHIDRHWHESLSLAEVAAVAGVHPQSLSRLLKRKLGRTFQEHLAAVRLNHAIRLLLENTHGVAEIAFACGFNNLANFNRQFRRRYACSPRDYRRFAADNNAF